MATLSEDEAKLIETLKLGKVHFIGLSMGGFVALRLAARRSDLIKSVKLMETSAQIEPNKAKYAFLNLIVKLLGVNPVANGVMKIMFGDTFLNDTTRKSEREK